MLDEPAARRGGPGVDARSERDELGDRRARDRPWRVSWSIQRCQSISVSSPAKRSPNSGAPCSQRLHARSSCPSTACRGRGGGRCGPRSTPSSHSSPSAPNVGLDRRARPWSAPWRGGEPDEHLAVLGRLAPRPACAPRNPSAGRARTACSGIARPDPRRPARLGMGDVDARESRLPPVRHDPSSGEPRKVAPGDMRGTGLSGTEGFAGVCWGRRPDHDSARNACTGAENGQQQRCRRRDSNPRHADYDSAALTD